MKFFSFQRIVGESFNKSKEHFDSAEELLINMEAHWGLDARVLSREDLRELQNKLEPIKSMTSSLIEIVFPP